MTVPRKRQPVKREQKRKSKKEGTAADLIPPDATLDQLREIATTCKACYLWQVGTQTVFGEGPSDAKLMFVGEQPGANTTAGFSHRGRAPRLPESLPG
jgi:hypothetical protein